MSTSEWLKLFIILHLNKRSLFGLSTVETSHVLVQIFTNDSFKPFNRTIRLLERAYIIWKV
jgi:hypothetical protein